MANVNPASGQYFPPELVRAIFENLTPVVLSKLTLVSRTWRNLAFPYLHRDITIKGLKSFKKFTSRIDAQPIHCTSTIGSCLRALAITFPRQPISISEDEDGSKLEVMRKFRSLIPKLHNLRYLKWEEYFFFDRPLVIDILQDIRDHCSALNGLTVQCYTYRPNNVDASTIESMSYLHKAFNLRNMKYLNIVYSHSEVAMMDGDPRNLVLQGRRSVQPDALVEMIRNSPDLVQLSLKDKASDVLGDIQIQLKSLRRLRLELDRDLVTRECTPLQIQRFVNFFRQHPQITDLELGWTNGFQTNSNSIPIADLLPSLKRFTGPVKLCMEVVSSPLAAQLEYLSVKDDGIEISDFVESIHELVQVAKPLPKLRELYIWAFDPMMAGTVSSSALNTLLAATPGLLALGISCFSLTQANLLSALTRVPKLRKLATRIMYTDESGLNDRQVNVVADMMIRRMRETCVGLSMLRFPLLNENNQLLLWRTREPYGFKVHHIIYVMGNTSITYDAAFNMVRTRDFPDSWR